MAELLAWIAIAMAALFATLVATIVIRRFLAERRRAREAKLRPPIETAVAEYLAAEEVGHPALASGRHARELLRTVALETMSELHGRERERLVALLERWGVVAETAAGLGSRRRRTRRAAAEALRQIGSEEATRSLVIGLEDSDLDTALTCAAALAELPDEERLPAIVALADRAAVARPGAVAAILVTLGRRHPSAIGDAIAPPRSLELRRLAAAVAGELRLVEHVPALHRALAEADDELAARAARGLGMIGDDGALDRLLALVEQEGRPWFVRLAATEALGAIGDPRAVGPLAEELKSDVWQLQAKAAKALGLLGDGGEAALRRARFSPTQAVREHARVALER